MEQIHAGRNLDEQGIPFGAIPASFVEGRSEARMVYPGAQEVFRRVERGTGSMVLKILSFDQVPAGHLEAGYVAPAPPDAVLDWYQAELGARGWSSRARRHSEHEFDALQGFDRPRQELVVTVPTRHRAQPRLDRNGVTWPEPGRCYFELQYRIFVRHPPQR
ncbi:MAG TPA: hypothetical protein DCQ30_08505 [Acidimicrobiaceae bacterium]|nr:hypothetical protein [Acidimicrobiaceae bacterium]